MTCSRQQQWTLIPLPHLCPLAAWPPALTVSHSGSSCPRSFCSESLNSVPCCRSLAPSFKPYFFAKMCRQNHPVLDWKKGIKRKERKRREKRNDAVTADSRGRLVSLFGAMVWVTPSELIRLWLWWGAQRQPERFTRFACFWPECRVTAALDSLSRQFLVCLSVRHPRRLTPANGSCRISQRQT